MKTSMRKFLYTSILATALMIASVYMSMAQSIFQLNDKEYLESDAISVFVFNNDYKSGLQSGIEIIQHGERVCTNGNLDLEFFKKSNEILQFGQDYKFESRTVNVKDHSITANLVFKAINLTYHITVTPEGEAFRIRLDLDKPIPTELVKKAEFSLSFFPGALFGKSYIMGDKIGIFPRQANGPKVFSKDDLMPLPMAIDNKVVIAPEDSLHLIEVESVNASMELIDGRNLAEHYWFILRSEIPKGAASKAIEWIVRPGQIKNWRRRPVLLYSQVGYHVNQPKKAMVELDKHMMTFENILLYKINENGTKEVVKSEKPLFAGQFLRYRYGVFDFSDIKTKGLYCLQYGTQLSNVFVISPEVYASDVWQPALEVFLPVQMCHMEVRDKDRLWHGACHTDDGMQAPVSIQHFDGYNQGSTANTTYQPFEHISGMNQGGWHDAGDTDLPCPSEANETYLLAMAYETFKSPIDQTSVDYTKNKVLLHKPDGIPDFVQQVKHGILNLIGPYRAFGHSIDGIIDGSWANYVQMSDPILMTDNKIYDSRLPEDSVNAKYSGRRDDRWIFTNLNSAQEMKIAGTFAAAYRVLKDFDVVLANECLSTAREIWTKENAWPEPLLTGSDFMPRNYEKEKIIATVELFYATKDSMYLNQLITNIAGVEKNISDVGWEVSRLIDYITDKAFVKRFKNSLRQYSQKLEKELASNPFGVRWDIQIWGIGWNLQENAFQYYFLNKKYPELFPSTYIFNIINYIMGCHPGSNVSNTSGVGAYSLTSAFGINRADYSYIPGGNYAGVALLLPDFPELKDPWPFIWQQSEYLVAGSCSFIFCVLAVDELCRKMNL
jgi:endoglucanase